MEQKGMEWMECGVEWNEMMVQLIGSLIRVQLIRALAPAPKGCGLNCGHGTYT